MRRRTPRVGAKAPLERSAYSREHQGLAGVSHYADESGGWEVVVRPFPGMDGRWQISQGGGRWPVWSDGDELFFRGPVGMMSASVEMDPTFSSEEPVLLFPTDDTFFNGGAGRTYDIHPHSERFLMVKLDVSGLGGDAGASAEIVIVQNWLADHQR